MKRIFTILLGIRNIILFPIFALSVYVLIALILNFVAHIAGVDLFQLSILGSQTSFLLLLNFIKTLLATIVIFLLWRQRDKQGFSRLAIGSIGLLSGAFTAFLLYVIKLGWGNLGTLHLIDSIGALNATSQVIGSIESQLFFMLCFLMCSVFFRDFSGLKETSPYRIVEILWFIAAALWVAFLLYAGTQACSGRVMECIYFIHSNIGAGG